MKLSQRNMFAKTFATGLAFLSFAALADTLWPTADDKKNAYWEDVWGEVDDYYVFKDVSDATALFRTYISLPNNRAIWVDGSNVVFEGDDADCGLVCSGNAWNSSMTVGRNRGYGLLTIKKGQYYLSSALYVGAGISGGKLVLDGGTVTAADGVFLGSGDNGAIGEIVVNEGAVLNSTASSGDKFSICKGANGHNDTKGYLTINGGTVNVASTLFTCQEGGTGDITINSGALNVKQNSYLARGYYNSSTSTLTMNGGTFWTGGNFELAAMENRNAGTATLNMNGGAIDVGGTIYWGGNKSGANVTVNMKGGSITATNHIEIAAGGGSTVNVTMDGGTITSMTSDHLYIANASGSTGNVTINDGKLESTTKRICVGQSGTGTLTVNGGEVTWGDQLIVAVNSGSTGTLNVNGGTVAKSSQLIQVGLNGTGYFNMTDGNVACSDFRLGSDSAGAVGVATMSGGTLFNGSLSVAGKGTGTFNLNGGVVEANNVVVGGESGTAGTLNLNGGTFKARQNNNTFIANSSKLTVNVGENGAVFDSAGYAITIPATLKNADGLVGNGMIWKKGLGTLTISSDLDLERMFKFTIDTDLGSAGVGPIALTGSNTLDAGDKITVEIDPVNAETNVAYTVMTGLGAYTMDNIVLTGTDFYTYTGEVTDGTLSVTLQYSPTAPITARYVNGAWKVYAENGEEIVGGEPSELTSYIFTGGASDSELATLAAAGKRIVLEAAGTGVTNTIAVAASIDISKIKVVTDDGCAVRLVGSEGAALTGTFAIGSGSLVLEGTVELDADISSGVVSIAEGAVVHLAKSQATTASAPSYFIKGTGELVLDDGVTLRLNDNYVQDGEYTFKYFEGMLTIGDGSVLDIQTGLHESGVNSSIGNNATLKMAGGTISAFTKNDGGSNVERIYNLVIADGTISYWNNRMARYSSVQGARIEVKGSVTGAGVLKVNTLVADANSDRGPYFMSSGDLSGFTGEIRILEGNCRVESGTLPAGKLVMSSGTHLHMTTALTVGDATLVLKGAQGKVMSGDTVDSAGTYTIGADATLGVAEGATVEGITFAAGATLEMLDDGALSDKTQTYVALTSKTPIAGPLPLLVQSSGLRGKWKLLAREVMESETTVYQLYTEFRPAGFVIIVQ